MELLLELFGVFVFIIKSETHGAMNDRLSHAVQKEPAYCELLPTFMSQSYITCQLIAAHCVEISFNGICLLNVMNSLT